MSDADLDFWFDPVCPFAWLTSEWVRTVAAQRDYRVRWRFISLRILNEHVDYAAQFPPDYEDSHTSGLRLLRVAARTRDEHGDGAVARLYEAMGHAVFDAPQADDPAAEARHRGTPAWVEPVLASVDLPTDLSAALDDDAWDATIREETERALELTGRDVGTPILHFEPPTGVAFFGPVISRLPAADEAVELWDHVVGLARFAGFAELKRSLRERPQVRAFGVEPGEEGVQEDWHGGSRRLHR